MRGSRGWSLEGPCSLPHVPPGFLREGQAQGGPQVGQDKGRGLQVKWACAEVASIQVGVGEGQSGWNRGSDTGMAVPRSEKYGARTSG